MAIVASEDIPIQIALSNDGKIGRVQLITWYDAEDAWRRTMKDFALTLKVECVRIDSWTSYKAWVEAVKVINSRYVEGLRAIEQHLLNNRRVPHGTQGFSTRRKYKIGSNPKARHRRTVFYFLKGKLPLPAREWRERYEARYRKKVKGKVSGRRRKDGRPTGTTKVTKHKLSDRFRYKTIKIRLSDAEYRNRTRKNHHKGTSSRGSASPRLKAKRKGKYGRPRVRRTLRTIRVLVDRHKYSYAYGFKRPKTRKNFHKYRIDVPSIKGIRPTNMNQYREWKQARAKK